MTDPVPPVDAGTDAHETADGAPPRAGGILPATARGWVASVAAMLFFAGSVGYMIGVGGGDDPPGRSSVDVGFLQDMISHHEQAIEMANVELAGGTEPDVEAFAREILTFQAYEIGVMEARLGEWGHIPAERDEIAMAWMHLPLPVDQMPGLASEDEMSVLFNAEGRDVDALFVRLMQDHHRGGIHMATAAEATASDPLVRDLAARMVRNQRVEVVELEGALKRAQLNPTPAGYVPAEIPADHGATGAPAEPADPGAHHS